MHEPYTQLHLDLIWATWDRHPVLRPEWRGPICACIQSQCAALKCTVLAVEAMPEHAHLLVRYTPTLDVATLAKGASSHLVTHQLVPGEWFKWQGCYGAFVVEKDSLPRVRRHVLNQEAHHRAGTLDEELERTSE